MSLVATSDAERMVFMERKQGELQSRKPIVDSLMRIVHVNSAEALEAFPVSTTDFVHVELGCCPLTNGLFEKILEISALVIHLDLSGNGNLGKRLKDWFSSSQSKHQNENYSFPKLETLTMAGNSLDDESAMIISKMVSLSLGLTRLNLRFNSISNYGLQSICSVTKALPKLSEIDLSCNNVGDDGIQTVCQILEETRQLRKISLAHNRLMDASNIFKAVEKSTLQCLDLSGNELFGKKASMVSLQQLFWPSSPALKELNISSTGLNDQLCITLFELLLKNSSINRLDISNNRITDAAAEGICSYLARSQSLIVELNMEGNSIFQSGIQNIVASILTRDLRHRVTLRLFNEKSTMPEIAKIRSMIKESKNARKWNLNVPPYAHISRETTDAILLQALDDVETSVFEVIEEEESRLIQQQNRGVDRSVFLGPRVRQTHNEELEVEDVNPYKDGVQPGKVGLQDFAPNEDLWDFEEPEGGNKHTDADDAFGGELLNGSNFTNFGAQPEAKTNYEVSASLVKPEQEAKPPASPLQSPTRTELMLKHDESEDESSHSQEPAFEAPNTADSNIVDVRESNPAADANKSQTEATLDHSLDSILRKIESQDITSTNQEVESPSQQERNRSKSQLDDVIEQMESVLRESSLKTGTPSKSPTIHEEIRESWDARSEENADSSENYDTHAPQEQDNQSKLNKRPNLHIEVPVIETPVLHPITSSLSATPESSVRQTPTQPPDQGAGTASSAKSLSRQQPSSSVSLKRDTMLASLKNEEYKATILNYKASKRKAKIVVSLEGAWMRVRKEPTLFKSAKPIQDFNLQSVTFEEWGTTNREIALHSSLLAQPWIIRIKTGSEGPFKLSLQTRGAQKTSS